MVQLNRSLILRLVKYLRVLNKLKGLGFVQVFSNNLADALGITPAVVRKDFSMINIPGNKRGGYNVDVLISELGELLGKQPDQKVVLVGCGRIGSALMEYPEFAKEGISIAAGFDASPEAIQSINGIPVYSMDKLAPFVKEHKITIAILAVPESAASQVFEDMLEAGIRGVLNFTSMELKCQGKCDRSNCKRQCTVQTVNIGLELENLFYLTHLESTKVAELLNAKQGATAEK